MIEVSAPASKSLSHRYLIAAALANGTSTLYNVLDCDDTQRTKEILSLAGASFITPDEEKNVGIKVHGTAGRLRGGNSSPLKCNVHESGTTCRLLTAVLASGQGEFTIDGTDRMRQRPIGELVRALRQLGCEMHYTMTDGFLPLSFSTSGLTGKNLPAVQHIAQHALSISMDESSQYFSGLLLASPQVDTPFTLSLSGNKAISWPYIGLTLQCLHDFGIKFLVENREKTGESSMWNAVDWRTLTNVNPDCLRIKIQPGKYRYGTFNIEGDWSGASYLVAAGVLGKEAVHIKGITSHSLQGDRALLAILASMGALIETTKEGIVVRPSALHGIRVDMGQCPDLVPTVAALAAFADGQTMITNVRHLRIKETDRIKAPALSLRAVGAKVFEHEDGLTITGLGSKARLHLGTVLFQACNDHRMAMSQALYSLRSTDIAPTEIRAHIDTPEVVKKSFPDFWRTWEAFSYDTAN